MEEEEEGKASKEGRSFKQVSKYLPLSDNRPYLCCANNQCVIKQMSTAPYTNPACLVSPLPSYPNFTPLFGPLVHRQIQQWILCLNVSRLS